MLFLKRQNENLLRRIESPEREEQSRTPHPTTNQSKAITLGPQTHQTSRNDLDLTEEAKPIKPFIDEIIDAPLPPVWKGLTIKPYDGSTDPD